MGVYAGPEITNDGLVLALDAANKKSYSQNEFQYSTDIVTFSGTGGSNSIITRDTISSPVGNTPLKMVVTGNDPHVGMYNNPSRNIAPAANGQTWIVSVYIKANVATTGQIFIFGAAADGNVFDAVTGQIAAGGVSIGTDWTRVSYAFTFTKGISFIQVRLDGPDTGGTGQTVWWDGLQVERVPAGTTTPTPFTSAYYGGSVFKDLVGSNNGTLVNYPTYSSENFGSIVFDGVDDSISITSNTNVAGLTNYSVSIWIYCNPNSSGIDSRFFWRGNYGVLLSKGTDDQFFFFLRTSITAVSVGAIGAFSSVGNWNNVVLTYDASTMRAYFNGNLAGSTSTSGGIINDNPTLVKLGFYPAAGFASSCRISSCLEYTRTLSAQEIQQNYNATKSRYGL